ncbi:lysylphosphatidylglycerol synthase domain-containing protein [Enterovirga sp.]|uniref:lysylphosphatidylglycerol synthase domain-containing protein n=1 Tax=Enterovirga sp. TaxID=2026350 RepID=UPI002619F266|nr:lysylphosphatidylglycerol synthase domain-containing protein [Enterovirga sp.]MDB5592920.1 hypothetical protein [Enterovirga sp.]
MSVAAARSPQGAATADQEARTGRKTWLLRGLLVLGICLAAYLIYRTLHRYSFDDIVAAVAAIPGSNLARAGGFAAASYLCLTGFDWLGLRYVGRNLSYPRAALASFTSLSLGHNIGFAGVSSGAIRYRFYARWGLSTGEVAKLVLFCGVTVGLGLLTLGAAALVLKPEVAMRLTGFDALPVRLLGLACVGLVATYLGLAWIGGTVTVRGFSLDMPKPTLALAQVAIGAVNFACVAACLHALVAAVGEASYFDVAGAYVTGNVTALLSHVPGGLGVIETAVMYLLPGRDLIGALIAFRVTYFFVPLAIGLVVFGLSELVFRRSGPPPAAPAQERR